MINYNNTVIYTDIQSISESLDYTTLSGSTILVTGATGMLATYVVYTLAHLKKEKALPLRIIALGRNKTKMMARFGNLIADNTIEPLYQDICSPLQFKGKFDYIIHLAGSANPASIISDPVGIVKSNTIGLISLMEIAREQGSKVLFASTREVYGSVGDEVTTISEGEYGAINPLDARSCYPESKRMAETICKSYNIQYAVPSVILRIAHSYGPGMNIEGDGRVMADLISDVISGRNIELNSSGEAIRSFCYISDAVEGLFRAMLSPFTCEVYNLANEREAISILGLAQLLSKACPEQNLKVSHRQASEQELRGYAKFRRIELNTSKIESIGWIPKVSLEEGVKRTIKSFKL